jgi:hypothetical protein
MGGTLTFLGMVVFLFSAQPSHAQDPRIAFGFRTFPSAGARLTVTNKSSQPITALALWCPAERSPSDLARPDLFAGADDAAWGWERPREGEVPHQLRFRPINPGETRTLVFMPASYVASCLKPGMPLGKLLGAAILADGSSVGQERFVKQILDRRKIAYQTIETAIQELTSGAPNERVPRATCPPLHQLDGASVECPAPASRGGHRGGARSRWLEGMGEVVPCI